MGGTISSSVVDELLSGLSRYAGMRSPSLLSSLTQSSAAFAMSMTVRGLPVWASSMVTLPVKPSQQGRVPGHVLRVARAHDCELAVKLDAVEAVVGDASLMHWVDVAAR